MMPKFFHHSSYFRRLRRAKNIIIMNSNAYDNPGFIIDYNVASSLCSIRKISHNNLIQRRSMSNEGNVKSFDIQYKVLLLGDTQVGKTSLQRSIMGRDFRPSIGSTFGFDLVNKIIQIERANVNLQIWDTAGQQNFRTMGKAHYASTRAFILVYDVTNKETFSLIEQFNRFIEQAKLDMQRRYLVANKIDLIDNRTIEEEEGRRFANRNSMTYFETSCRTGENIADLFEQIASDLVRQHNPEILESHRPGMDNFVYIYHPSPDNNNQEQNNNNEQAKNPKKNPHANTSLMREKRGCNFCRLLFCCNPKQTTATSD